MTKKDYPYLFDIILIIQGLIYYLFLNEQSP